MTPELKNKMTNIISGICLLTNQGNFDLDKMKQIINDNDLDESVKNKINKANTLQNLINALQETVKSENEDFEKLFEKIEENIKLEEKRIHNKDQMVKKLSSFLQNVKNDFKKSKTNISEIAEKIQIQSLSLDMHYKETTHKSFTKKWLKNISKLKYNKPTDETDENKNKYEKEYLQNLKEVLSKKPKVFEGISAAISDKTVQKDLKELIKIIDKKIKAY